jgi:hypothetical protein
MAHEITEHDNVVLHRTPAWHGLGVVVQDAPTPMEALKIAGLDWNVEQWPMSATNGETRLMVDDQLNVRMPGAIKLGIVGQHYKVVQNVELAQFCQDLAEQNRTIRFEWNRPARSGRAARCGSCSRAKVFPSDRQMRWCPTSASATVTMEAQRSGRPPPPFESSARTLCTWLSLTMSGN